MYKYSYSFLRYCRGFFSSFFSVKWRVQIKYYCNNAVESLAVFINWFNLIYRPFVSWQVKNTAADIPRTITALACKCGTRRWWKGQGVTKHWFSVVLMKIRSPLCGDPTILIWISYVVLNNKDWDTLFET